MSADRDVCRCGDDTDVCPSCQSAIDRAEDARNDYPSAADYDRLEAGPWWHYPPDMAPAGW